MDSEKPPSLRGLIARIVGTLIGLLLLYVLSAGPADYVAIRWHTDTTLMWYLYIPAQWLEDNTPLQGPLGTYGQWWSDLAVTHREADRK